MQSKRPKRKTGTALAVPAAPRGRDEVDAELL